MRGGAAFQRSRDARPTQPERAALSGDFVHDSVGARRGRARQQENYDMAKQEFDEVLKKDPSNSLALASMAPWLYSASSGTPEQRTAALEDARKWNQRRIEVDRRMRSRTTIWA